jgi:hypothetical protein
MPSSETLAHGCPFTSERATSRTYRPATGSHATSWEYGGWTAVRMGNWKAVRPRGGRGRNAPEPAWELYDLATDIEEKNDLSEKHPDVLAKMKAIAEKAHEDPREGTFHNRAIHERDKQAKFGFEKQAAAEPAHTLPEDGLIPRKQYKLVRASSESKANGKLAVCAFDGAPGTWWHSKFTGTVEQHPHELVIDLGKKHTVRGFRYLARQNKGWNGAVRECAFYVSDSPDAFDKPAVQATLRKSKEPQEVACDPVAGRYVRLVALSEVNGQPWASVSELGILGE